MVNFLEASSLARKYFDLRLPCWKEDLAKAWAEKRLSLRRDSGTDEFTEEINTFRAIKNAIKNTGGVFWEDMNKKKTPRKKKI